VMLQLLRGRTLLPNPVTVYHKIEAPIAPREAPAPPVETAAVDGTPSEHTPAALTEPADAAQPVPAMQSAAVASPVDAPLPVVAEPPSLNDVLASMDAAESRIGALTAVLKRWGAALPGDTGPLETTADDTYFSLVARQDGLETLRVVGRFNIIRRLNLPAILAFPAGDGSATRYLAVVEASNAEVRLSNGTTSVSIPEPRLDETWRGVAYILWKNYHNYQGTIPSSSPGEEILALKMHLKAQGYPIAQMTPAYDIATRSAVESIQARNGLQVDGKVGPQTKIAIYNEDRSLTMPRLTNSPGA
jgi:general secretion pathway protein A